jgi:hypothetical protein
MMVAKWLFKRSSDFIAKYQTKQLLYHTSQQEITTIFFITRTFGALMKMRILMVECW